MALFKLALSYLHNIEEVRKNNTFIIVQQTHNNKIFKLFNIYEETKYIQGYSNFNKFVNSFDVTADKEDWVFEYIWLKYEYYNIDNQDIANKLFSIAVYTSPNLANTLIIKVLEELLEHKNFIAVQDIQELIHTINFLTKEDCSYDIISLIKQYYLLHYIKIMNNYENMNIDNIDDFLLIAYA